MSLTRAVVIGRSGQVARALGQALQGVEVLFTSSAGAGGSLPLDLGKKESIPAAFKEIATRFGPGPVEVFLAGAMTHVDRCEQEKERCRAINLEGPALVAEECRRMGYGLTYFSTEYVFGGAEYEGGSVGPFAETDPPHPTSWYGECKLGAERAIQEIFGSEEALIARTTMVFSWDPEGMNFLMQYLRQLEGGGKIFRVPVDQKSTPTYAPALAEAVVQLRNRRLGGIYHLAGPDLLSRKELLELVASEFGFTQERVRSLFEFVKTADLGQAALRPLTAGLKVDKARAAGVRVDSLREAFADVKRLRSAVRA